MRYLKEQHSQSFMVVEMHSVLWCESSSMGVWAGQECAVEGFEGGWWSCAPNAAFSWHDSRESVCYQSSNSRGCCQARGEGI